MNPIATRIISKGQMPSRADIAELLASIGSPGEKQTVKEAAVRDLFDELGHRGSNSQGHHVADTLSSYEEF